MVAVSMVRSSYPEYLRYVEIAVRKLLKYSCYFIIVSIVHYSLVRA